MLPGLTQIVRWAFTAEIRFCWVVSLCFKAWEQLSDDDRYCLETFYGDGNTYGSSAAYYIAEYLHIEQPTAYKRKNRALDRLTVLLFGKS